MTDELTDLYQEIILDHNKNPRCKCELEDSTHKADGHNPLCGDEIVVYLKLKDEVIEDISFTGQGCAISQASASLMTSSLKGKTLGEAKKICEEANDILTSDESVMYDLSEVGDLAALSGVRKFPIRIKCATLSWHTFNSALKGDKTVSTE